MGCAHMLPLQSRMVVVGQSLRGHKEITSSKYLSFSLVPKLQLGNERKSPLPPFRKGGNTGYG